MRQYVTVGLAVLAGAALFEAALVPGVVVGAAAMLAPNAIPGLRRRLGSLLSSTARPRTRPATASRERADVAAQPAIPAKLGIKRAVAKTVTFRIVVTTLDFTTNYLVLGELATAAGLSAFALVAGPVFYLVHETAWNYFGRGGGSIDLAALLPRRAEAGPDGRGRFAISQALAKTITFRSIASIVDFAATYLVVGDLATAAGLSAFGLVLGPFVYYGHEVLWDRFGAMQERAADQATPRLLPAPRRLLPAPTGGDPQAA